MESTNNNINVVPTDNKSKSKLIILIVAAVLFSLSIIWGIIIISITHKGSIKINLDDYFSSMVIPKNVYDYVDNTAYGEVPYDTYDTYGIYEYGYPFGLLVSGYDKTGYILDDVARYTVDWVTLKEDISSKLQKKKISITTDELNSLIDIYDFEVTVNKSEDISNGEYITVTVKPNKESYAFQDIEVKFTKESYEYVYQVTGLEQGSDIDLFSYVRWTKRGPNGKGEIGCKIANSFETTIEGHPELTVEKFSDDTISILANGYIVAKVNFYVDEEESSNGYFSNGDTFQITCYVEGADVLESDYNLILRNISKTYTVNGLGEYITKDYAMSQSDIDYFKNDSKKYCEEYENEYHSDNLNISYVGMYLGDITDKQYGGDAPRNLLCVIYKATYHSYWYTEDRVEYYFVVYSDLCADEDSVYSLTTHRTSTDDDSVDHVLHYVFEDPYNKGEGYFYRQIA